MERITAGIQASSLPGYLLILALAAYLWRHEPEFRGLLIMPAAWALYGAVYYVLVLAGFFSPEALLLWGALHRWIAMLMILGGMVINALILREPPPVDPPDDYPGGDDG